MVENVSLNIFKFQQRFFRTKCIKLDRHAVLRWFELTDNEGHVVNDLWVSAKISEEVMAEDTDVGLLSAVANSHY